MHTFYFKNAKVSGIFDLLNCWSYYAEMHREKTEMHGVIDDKSNGKPLKAITQSLTEIHGDAQSFH